MAERRINRERLISSLEELSKIGVAPDGLRTRLALGDEDKQGRDLLCKWIRSSGFDLKIDAIGNIFGLLGGKEETDPIMAGSHIDTVRNAGMFDGCVGVLGALECLRTISEKGLPHRKPLALAAFTNEEGARYHPDMMGSLVASGLEKVEDMYASVDDEGKSVLSELERIGYKGCDVVKPSAYLEYHIEQGPFLDKKGIQLGVVTGIQGINWWHGRFVGQANHAGTTPMNMRNDALLALSQVHVRMTEIAKRTGACFTIGRVQPQPSVVNIIPGEVSFSLDLRHPVPEILDQLNLTVVGLMNQAAAENGLKLEMKQTADARPVVFDAEMVGMVERYAVQRGLSSLRLFSGAGHDAQMMARIVPTTMIFVPSIGGKSHCPQEQSDMEQICDGAEVLLDCLLELAC